MIPGECVSELHARWLPHVTDAGLDRLIDLLEKGSPMLVHGRFTGAIPMGCLASHIGWNHPAVCHRTMDAGILWLTRVAGLNPATSKVIREWDDHGGQNWPLRQELAGLFRAEKSRRTECPLAG
ncbi:MAG: hypothetical protein K1X57_04745 [Gemmataceae bacterium]|nr:hypothetical protein [Gemmataceae bacterium]